MPRGLPIIPQRTGTRFVGWPRWPSVRVHFEVARPISPIRTLEYRRQWTPPTTTSTHTSLTDLFQRVQDIRTKVPNCWIKFPNPFQIIVKHSSMDYLPAVKPRRSGALLFNMREKTASNFSDNLVAVIWGLSAIRGTIYLRVGRPLWYSTG